MSKILRITYHCVEIVSSPWFWLVGLVLLVLLIMPANSPVGILGGYKVLPASLFVILLFQILIKFGEHKEKGDKDDNTS